MKKYLFLLVCCTGCATSPSTAPITEPTVVQQPIAPTFDKPAFYQGYAVVSKFDCTTHTFQKVGTDSVAAQIRAGISDGEIRATVSCNDQTRPYDVFLFSQGNYYLGNDSTSYAYFSKDYNTIVWGAPSGESGLYRTVYASR